MSNGWQGREKNPAYNTEAWKRARVAALKRAGYRCELRLDCCTRRATEVDHVLGIDNDPGHKNLRAVCKPCHRRVTAQQGNAARQQSRRKPDPAPRPRTRWT